VVAPWLVAAGIVLAVVTGCRLSVGRDEAVGEDGTEPGAADAHGAVEGLTPEETAPTVPDDGAPPVPPS
jgi:hypothetical protein